MKKYVSVLFLLYFFQSSPNLTYQQSGVSIDNANSLVRSIKSLASTTSRAEAPVNIGNFGSIIDLSKSSYKDPLLITTTDGVGTKLLLAQQQDKMDSVGIDLVAMCVNDLLAQGAEPIGFLDYYATGKLHPQTGEAIIKSIIDGCTRSNCALMGGETAELPGMYNPEQLDLAGFAIGIVERNQLLPKTDLIKEGDVIIGLPSSGIHSNGFSLIRKIIDDNNFDINSPAPFATHHATFADALLEPTVIYTKHLLPLCKKNLIKAAAHITGGGLLENLPRVLPDHLGAELDVNQWNVPSIFRWFKQVGEIEEHEMFRTFNCGIGMAVIADQKSAQTILDQLNSSGMNSSVIGQITYPRNERIAIKGNFPTAGMKVLVVGSGGREHALAWKFAQSPHVGLVLTCPGNGGTAQEKKVRNLPINVQHTNALLTYAKQQGIDLVVIGPEGPLAAGIIDECNKKGLRCFGPTKNATLIESSKAFAKQFMMQHNIPTPSYEIFSDIHQAQEYIRAQQMPLVIKADGLAGGKGVIIAQTQDEALNAAEQMLAGGLFGDAGKKIVVEQFIDGEEASFIVMCDGTNIQPLATSQDHKKRDVGERGPNTGGMGAVSPALIITPQLHNQIMNQIIKPTVQGLKAEGKEFTGFLYAGLMIKDGKPYVLEFNCRMGDPETQAILMRLKSDLFVACNAAVDKQLDKVNLEWDTRAALGVVLAAEGYPTSYKKGDVIVGAQPNESNEVKVFHSGTSFTNNRLITNGGRVFCSTALGNTLQEARDNAYNAIKNIYWPGVYYRNDIGYRALNK